MTNRLATFAFVALVIAAAGCSDASGPAKISEYGDLNKLGQTEFLGSPGEQLAVLPAVQVLDNRTWKPLADITVRFTTSRGPALDYITTTGADGIARLNSLKLNNTPLQYTITATANGIGSVDFPVVAVSSTVTAKYEKKVLNDAPANAVRHIYELFDDGTYAEGAEQNGTVTLGTRARFDAVSTSNVVFCRDPRSLAGPGSTRGTCGFVLAYGAIADTTMTVTYPPNADYIDFPSPEDLYVRVAPESPTAQSAVTSDWRANATVISVNRGSATACGWGTSAGDTRNAVDWRIVLNSGSISLDEDMRNYPTDDVPYSGHLTGTQFTATYKSDSNYASFTCQFREARLAGTFTSDSTFEAEETLFWGNPGGDTSVQRHWTGSRN